jgi:hypothetical protein
VTFYQRFNQVQAFIAGLRWGSSLTELLDVSFSPAFSCSNSFELFPGFLKPGMKWKILLVLLYSKRDDVFLTFAY